MEGEKKTRLVKKPELQTSIPGEKNRCEDTEARKTCINVVEQGKKMPIALKHSH